MKLSRLLFLITLATLVAMSATVAKADTVADPSIITRDPGPPANCPGDPSCFDGSSALVVAFNPLGFTADYTYDGTADLDALEIDLSEVPTSPMLTFQCFSDIWVQCNFGLKSVNEDGTLTYAFFFNDLFDGGTAGSSGPCQNNTPAGGTCPGFLVAGHVLELTLNTPEPSSILLLVAGLVPVLGFGWKRRRIAT